MTQLVYHAVSAADSASPFDEAILRIARTGNIKIVSPYIGIAYLQRILDVSDDWVLISDIAAWLSSLSVRARFGAWAFIRGNLARIHHCPAVHAKTVIGDQLAFIGSANLTHTGILGRTEMSVLLDDPALIKELHAWFDAIWSQTAPPVVDETNAFVQWLDQAAQEAIGRAAPQQLSSPQPKIRARLTPVQPVPPALDLGELAQALVTQDAEAGKSLAAAMAESIAALAWQSFGLQELVAHIQVQTGYVPVREIYEAVLPFCANHARTVFALDTVNRLFVSDGRFTQATDALLLDQIKPFDAYLASLTHHLSFEDAKALPDSDELAHLTRIRPGLQSKLMASLLEAGFIYEDEPGFILNEAFDWTGRYRLFVTAERNWKLKIEQILRHEPTPIKTDHLQLAGASATEQAYKHIEDAAEPVAPPSGTGSLLRQAVQGEKRKTTQQRRQALDRGDTVYREVVRLAIRRGSNFLPFETALELAHEIRGGCGAMNQGDIQAILFGKASAVSQMLSIVFVPGIPRPCQVSLIDNGLLAEFPLTAETLAKQRAKGREPLPQVAPADLPIEAPVAQFVPHPPEVPKPMALPAPRRKAPIMLEIADGIYTELIYKLPLQSDTLPISMFAGLIAAVWRRTLSIDTAQVSAILDGTLEGVPKLLSFDFGSDGPARCKVRLLSEADLPQFPMTASALQRLHQKSNPVFELVRQIVPITELLKPTTPRPVVERVVPRAPTIDRLTQALEEEAARKVAIGGADPILARVAHALSSMGNPLPYQDRPALIRAIKTASAPRELVESVLMGLERRVPKVFAYQFTTEFPRECRVIWLAPRDANLAEFPLLRAALENVPASVLVR